MSIVCNENVYCSFLREVTTSLGTVLTVHRFTPAPGYALWRDNEEGNIDPETGEPYCYWYEIDIMDAENQAPHIWAKLIDETMEVYGTDPNQPEVATFSLRRTATNPADDEEATHTYIDENGVERDKKGVY